MSQLLQFQYLNPSQKKYENFFLLVSVKILRNDGSECEAHELGRIAIKLPLPPGVMSTLYRAPERFIQVYFSKYPVRPPRRNIKTHPLMHADMKLFNHPTLKGFCTYIRGSKYSSSSNAPLRKVRGRLRSHIGIAKVPQLFATSECIESLSPRENESCFYQALHRATD